MHLCNNLSKSNLCFFDEVLLELYFTNFAAAVANCEIAFNAIHIQTNQMLYVQQHINSDQLLIAIFNETTPFNEISIDSMNH